MTVARSVADVLTDLVVFEVECVDRMYLNVYVRGLQYPAGLVAYVHRQLGLPIASTAPLGKISDAFSAAMRRFARDQQVPFRLVVEFAGSDGHAGGFVEWGKAGEPPLTYLADGWARQRESVAPPITAGCW